MYEKKHRVSRKVWFFSFWRWTSLFLFILLILCFLLKCCNSGIVATEDRAIKYNQDGKISQEEDLWVFERNRLPLIDTNSIELLPNDPLKRLGVRNLLNLYLQDTTQIVDFVRRVRDRFPYDSINVNYYADQYKRVQFKIETDRVEILRHQMKIEFPEVKFIVPEWVITSFATRPSDPGFAFEDSSWYHKEIGLYNAWETTIGDSNITVEVIDGGFDDNHPELIGKLVKPWNVFDYSDLITISGPEPLASHGTHVASTIAGNANNGLGVSGIAPGCKLMPIQISDRSGIISISSILDGIFYALKNEADIINISLALDMSAISSALPINEQEVLSRSILIEEAAMWDEVFEIARNENVFIVQAAGNDGVLASIDPMKRSKNCVIVGALNRKGKVSSFSNHGKGVTVYAPGEDIYNATNYGNFDMMDGSSMASPIVAGCIALLMSVLPELELKDFKLLLSNLDLNRNDSNIPSLRIDDLINEVL